MSLFLLTDDLEISMTHGKRWKIAELVQGGGLFIFMS
jgi:hypothetical protein